jgi:glucose/arabinose dehydrogenase
MTNRKSLSLLLILLAGPAASHATPPVIAKASSAIQIDGQVELQWGLTQALPLRNAIVLYDMLDPGNVVPEPADLSGKARLLWDSEYLYLLAMIVDENPQAPYTGTWFREDTVELYLDLDLSGESGDGQYDGVNDWEIGVHPMADPVEIVLGPNSVQDKEGFLAAATLTGNGYFLEVAFPWTTLGLAGPPAAGARIAVDVHVVDNDNQSGAREHKLAWSGTVDEAWRDTRTLGQVVLGDSASPLSDPVPDPLPSNGTGVMLSPLVKIPNSPATGAAPRLNMLKEAPDGSGRLFVIDQLGYLYLIRQDKTVIRYLDIRQQLGADFLYTTTQNGSTSFAFHSEFGSNGKFYVVTSSPTTSGTPDFFAKRPIDPSVNGTDPRQPQFHDVLLEFTADNPTADTFTGTYRELLRIEQPYNDHNVGEVAFNPNAVPGDPDYGMLYMAIADGGNKFPIDDADPEDNAQDAATIHGTIIRIDPMGTNSNNGKYGIPVDNPFANSPGSELAEIWSYGHRNNHRITWDRQGDHAMYAFDMGQEMIEEVNRIVPGGNYGWSNREGTFVINEFNSSDLSPIPAAEEIGSYSYPVFQYDHPENSGAIAGGAVYRGSRVPALYGKVILADFTGNRGAYYGFLKDTKSLAYGTTAPLHHLDIYSADGTLSDLSTALLGPSGTRRTDVRISTDLSGEVYFTNKRNGWIHTMHPTPDSPPFAWPAFFPDAVEVTPGFLYSESMDLLYYLDWPWVYSYSIGWFQIQETAQSVGDSGFWIYKPK